MMNVNTIKILRGEIKELLQIKFPSNRVNSLSGIKWKMVEEKYGSVDPIFKKNTLLRHLGELKDDNTLNSAKYDNLQSLQDIKKIIEGNYRKLPEAIILTSSNTSNFQGFYLILSPSSGEGEGMLNLFPLEILPNGDFELNYVHIGDIIRGITSFSTNHISLYANSKYNSTTQSYIPFFLHSVFNVQSSTSRNDLKPFNLGVATRRKRDTNGLKAVMEILIKIDKPLFEAFKGTALTLEKGSDGKQFHLLRGTREYLDEKSTATFLQHKVEVEAKASKGALNLIEKELSEIVGEFFNILIDNGNNINLVEKDFNRVFEIEKKLKL